jgi:oligopeptide transport system ATP-binding protein
MTDTPLLEVRDLRTWFHTRDGLVKAVDGVSLEVYPGETLGLVGESGCGKSVASLSLMRLVPAPGVIEEGSMISFAGHDVLSMNRKELEAMRGQQISMIFQQPASALNPVVRIGAQISEVFEIHQGLDREEGLERAAEMLQRVGISDVSSRIAAYPHEFSGGMAQRVMIAMALACEPQLLIADEPTTALDVTIQAQILDLVREMRDALGTAIVLITHDLGVVAGLADEIAVMYAGKIVEQAPARELFANPSHPYTLGLLRCIPRLDRDQGRLTPIPGRPPDLRRLGAGCPFAPRCSFALDRCREAYPEVRPVGPVHHAACWVEVAAPAGA